MSARLVSFDLTRTELTPGTVLVREWDRQSQRVMVMSDGFAWNGQTYDSLSKVAFAITGTIEQGLTFPGEQSELVRTAVIKVAAAQGAAEMVPDGSRASGGPPLLEALTARLRYQFFCGVLNADLSRSNQLGCSRLNPARDIFSARLRSGFRSICLETSFSISNSLWAF